MSKYQSELTSPLKVAQALAGDKMPKVLEVAREYAVAGKSPERALADALEKLKLAGPVPDKKVEE